jgi:hypothetical protein
LFDPFALDKMWLLFKEEFEDTKGLIGIRISFFLTHLLGMPYYAHDLNAEH